MKNARQGGKVPAPVLFHDQINLERAITQLPSECRWVMMLAVGEGLTAEEIAGLAGVEVEAVNEVLTRGQRMIQVLQSRLSA